MGAIPFWDDGPPEVLAELDDLSARANPWNVLVVAGERIPGLVFPPKGAIERSVDIKKPLGAKAATIAFHGDDPVKFDWDLLIWTPAQWDAFQAMLPIIQPRKPDAYPSPLEATHPSIAFAAVKAIFFTRIGLPDIDNGIGTIPLSALEWTPKPKPVKKPATAVPPVVNSSPPWGVPAEFRNPPSATYPPPGAPSSSSAFG